jgi:hypothetical protein
LAEQAPHLTSFVLAFSNQAAGQGASLDETKTKIIPILLQKYGTQFPPDFSKTVIANAFVNPTLANHALALLAAIISLREDLLSRRIRQSVLVI